MGKLGFAEFPVFVKTGNGNKTGKFGKTGKKPGMTIYLIKYEYFDYTKVKVLKIY
jgi:hypothetical protein